MANIQIKDATSTSVYVKSSGAGSSGDPHVTEHLETNSSAIKTALEGRLDTEIKWDIIRKEITVTRASASAVSLNVNGIITADSDEFHELTLATGGNAKSVMIKKVRIVSSGGAQSSIGNLNVLILNDTPASSQTEGSTIVLSAADGELFEHSIACWNKKTSTSTSVHVSDDSSDYIFRANGTSRSIFVALESASAWDVTGSEEFRIAIDFYRID